METGSFSNEISGWISEMPFEERTDFFTSRTQNAAYRVYEQILIPLKHNE